MRTAYESQGWAVVRDVVDPAPLLAALPPGGPLVPVPDPGLGVLDVLAEEVLGGPAEVFGATYVVKPARTGLPALWHQDGHPWTERLGGAAATTLWVALDLSNPETGGLRVIPGSHRIPAQPLRPNPEPSLFGVEVDPVLVDESLAVDVLLEPGDVSIHHPNLIHGSGPNRSDRPRRALAVRYRAT